VPSSDWVDAVVDENFAATVIGEAVAGAELAAFLCERRARVRCGQRRCLHADRLLVRRAAPAVHSRPRCSPGRAASPRGTVRWRGIELERDLAPAPQGRADRRGDVRQRGRAHGRRRRLRLHALLAAERRPLTAHAALGDGAAGGGPGAQAASRARHRAKRSARIEDDRERALALSTGSPSAQLERLGDVQTTREREHRLKEPNQRVRRRSATSSERARRAGRRRFPALGRPEVVSQLSLDDAMCRESNARGSGPKARV
jgi:hypothetical protein